MRCCGSTLVLGMTFSSGRERISSTCSSGSIDRNAFPRALVWKGGGGTDRVEGANRMYGVDAIDEHELHVAIRHRQVDGLAGAFAERRHVRPRHVPQAPGWGTSAGQREHARAELPPRDGLARRLCPALLVQRAEQPLHGRLRQLDQARELADADGSVLFGHRLQYAQASNQGLRSGLGERVVGAGMTTPWAASPPTSPSTPCSTASASTSDPVLGGLPARRRRPADPLR
jgi:hypothetical protein